MKLLIARSEKEPWLEFEAWFKNNNADISRTDSCPSILEKIKKEKFDLIIVDETLPDGTDGLNCIRQLTMTDPFANCAAISGFSKKDFHEAGEGLGVLMCLPPNPGKDDAKALFDHLTKILDLIKGSAP